MKTLKKFIFSLIIINLIIVFFLSIFLVIRPLIMIAFGMLTVSLTLFLASLTTINYQKTSKKTMLKRVFLSKYKIKAFKAKMFLELLFYGILFVAIWLLYVYWFSLEGWGVNQEDLTQVINWTKFSFLMYFYYGVAEVTMIIVFFYLINHLVKRANLVYMIIIITIFYLLTYSSLTYHSLSIRKIDNEYYLSWRSDQNKWRIIINTFLLPWSSFDLFGKNLFFVASEKSHAHNINWFDMSHMNVKNHTTYGGFFKTITWNPFIISFLPFLLFNTKKYNFK